MSNIESKKKVLIGTIVSDKMDKTAVVAIVRRVKHPLYQKIVKRTTKLHIHDKDNACKIGDLVKIVESRPISKTKAWSLLEIVKKAE